MINNKSLIIFDFDYTIAKTSEKIWVVSPRGNYFFDGTKYNVVHPRDMTNIAKDEGLNNHSFHEFFDINLSKAKAIQPVIRNLIYYNLIAQEKIKILTARPQCCDKKIKSFLMQFNLNLNIIHIKGLQDSKAMSKINYIKTELEKKEYNQVIIYEDNLDVINLVKKNFIPSETNFIKNLYNRTEIISEYNYE
tara:strand:- start:946 stop:1521 length:576 start_codon:yes stop_codon:yes gene_type:complete